MKTLTGKISLITGGSRGIGAATAKLLAERGSDIAITYSKSKEAAEELVKVIAAESGVKAKAYQANAADRKQAAEVVAKVVKDFGALDVLVNNAGTFLLNAITDVPDEEYDQTLNVNVSGVFATGREAAKQMREGGRIINIGSILGERAVGAGMSVYNMSKFAVQGFSRSWAHDLAPRKITVNVVQPGPIDTEMNPADSEEAKYMSEMVPLKRYGRPEEVAAVVAFLAGPESSYVNGAVINVDGGMNA